MSITQQEYERRIKNRFPEEDFQIISYESLGKPLTIRCKQCNEIIQVSKASNFVVHSKAFGCKNCHGQWRNRENKLEELKKYYKIINTQVKDTHTYYTIQCNNCGHQRTSTLRNLHRHLQCGCKTGTLRARSGKEFIDTVNKSTQDQYSLVGEYINQTTKVLIRHDKCGFIRNVSPNDAIAGKCSCPKCYKHESKNSYYITQLLSAYNIYFEKEKRLKNSKQRFDFYLENEYYKIAIEYNGIQHYKEVAYFQTSLAQQQMRDLKKQQYCLQHGIELYIIPYTYSKSEIKEVIDNIINKFNDYPEQE